MKLTFASLVAMTFLAVAPSLAQTPTTGTSMKPATPPPTTTMPVKPTAATPAAAAPNAQLLDINSATADQLGALKGIGKVRSAAIIKGRPYKGKDELVQKGIIPQSVYDDVKDKIIARQK